MNMVQATIESIPVERPKIRAYWRQNLCLDRGYDYAPARKTVVSFGYTPHIRPRGEEAAEIRHNPRFKARRWVVERTHSWLNRFRRLLIRWEKEPRNYLALLHFASAIIAFRAAGVLR
jgi:putative transposase